MATSTKCWWTQGILAQQPEHTAQVTHALIMKAEQVRLTKQVGHVGFTSCRHVALNMQKQVEHVALKIQAMHMARIMQTEHVARTMQVGLRRPQVQVCVWSPLVLCLSLVDGQPVSVSLLRHVNALRVCV